MVMRYIESYFGRWADDVFYCWKKNAESQTTFTARDQLQQIIGTHDQCTVNI